MDTLLVKPSNKAELTLLRQLLKKMNIAAEILSEEDLEDQLLLKAMDEKRSGSFVSEEEVMKELS
ncbi:MAG: hypothetical protein WBA23_18570 [Tunicatimonas sp.]|uniref:hypothetical protein n=1 Tax=Tunicatimonas sp. TaxID=1940096 RepID=UPI003C718400